MLNIVIFIIYVCSTEETFLQYLFTNSEANMLQINGKILEKNVSSLLVVVRKS